MTIANGMGAAIPAGSSQCGFVAEQGEAQCTQTATVHAMIDAQLLWSAPLCPEHLDDVSAVRVPTDLHPWGGFCNIPGAHWVISKPSTPGRCEIPITTEEHSIANHSQGALA